MRYNAIIALLLCWSTVLQGATPGGTPQPARYLFLQQLNAMCFLAPMYNCKRLERLLALHPLPAPADATEEALSSWLDAIPATGWYNRRQWFGIADDYVYPWHVAMNPRTFEDRGYPQLAQYFEDALSKAPIQPHYYTKNGADCFPGKFKGMLPWQNSYAKGEYHIDLPGLIKIATIPFFLTDHVAIYSSKFSSLSVFESIGNQTRPYGKAGDTWYKFNRAIKQFDVWAGPEGAAEATYGPYLFDANAHDSPFTIQTGPAQKTDIMHFLGKIKIDEDDEDKEALSLKNLTGFDHIIVNNLDFSYIKRSILNTSPHEMREFTSAYGYHKKGDENPTVSWKGGPSSYSPYCMGLYKFILLRLGLDADHNKIGTSHPQFGVHDELTKISAADPAHNLWSDRYLSEDNFLPCQIASIFKESAELFDEAQSVINFSALTEWASYTQFLDGTQTPERDASIYRDRNGTPYVRSEVLDYLPGPEQALAYIIAHTLRLLWYGTLSREAFYEYSIPLKLGGADTRSESLNALIQRMFSGVNWSYENFVKQAGIGSEHKKQNSFIKVWHKILAAITERSDRKYWVSFDNHGWVMILDQRLIALQKTFMHKHRLPNLKHKLKVLAAIKCIGIESSHSKILSSFYKK